MHGEMCPPTLREAKPKAGSCRRPAWPTARTADGSRSPEVDAISSPADRSSLNVSYGRSVTPTKINRGGSRGTNDTWARTGRDAVGSTRSICRIAAVGRLTDERRHKLWRRRPPGCGRKPAKGRLEPQERRRATTSRGKEPASPGQAAHGPVCPMNRAARRMCRARAGREARAGSGTPREEGAMANDPHRAADARAKALVWTGRARA
jgi:hypothetical protein